MPRPNMWWKYRIGTIEKWPAAFNVRLGINKHYAWDWRSVGTVAKQLILNQHAITKIILPLNIAWSAPALLMAAERCRYGLLLHGTLLVKQKHRGGYCPHFTAAPLLGGLCLVLHKIVEYRRSWAPRLWRTPGFLMPFFVPVLAHFP